MSKANASAASAIVRAFSAMPEVHASHDDCKRTLLDKCIADERRHRQFNEGTYALTVATAARLQAVQWLARSVQRPWVTVEDYLTMREAAFYAAAVAATHREMLTQWANSEQVRDVCAMDYAELVKG